MSDEATAGSIKQFSFDKAVALEIQSWIDQGYFATEADIFDTAFRMVYTAVKQLRADKKAVSFAHVEVDVTVEVDPGAIRKGHELN